MNNKRIILGLSGGIDSVVTAYWLRSKGFEITAVYFSGYSLADDQQHKAALYFCSKLGIALETVDFSFYPSLPISSPEETASEKARSVNALFFLFSTLCLIAIRTNTTNVSIGITEDDHKKHPKLVQSLREIAKSISTSTQESTSADFEKLQALFPFTEHNKTQILQQANILAVPLKPTYSCSQGTIIHCGICPCCQKRRDAASKAGIKDATVYVNTSQ